MSEEEENERLIHYMEYLREIQTFAIFLNEKLNLKRGLRKYPLFLDFREWGLFLDRRTVLPQDFSSTSRQLDIFTDDELLGERASIDDLHARSADNFAKNLLFDKSIARHFLPLLEMLFKPVERYREELLID